jgi:hypothetical protein
MIPFRAVVLILIIVAAGATVAAYPAIKGSQVTSTGTITSSSNTTTTSVSSSSMTTTLPSQTNGTLYAIIDVGPIQPVCRVNSTTGPAPSYSSIELMITSSSGTNQEVPLIWLSNSCDAFTSAHVSLVAGAYTLNLTSCNYMGCGNSLPRGFAIANGQTTTVQVSVDTGIR